jgi:hypothetical protein
LATTSPTSGGRSVGIVRSRTRTVEFFFLPTLYQMTSVNLNWMLWLQIQNRAEPIKNLEDIWIKEVNNLSCNDRDKPAPFSSSKLINSTCNLLHRLSKKLEKIISWYGEDKNSLYKHRSG